MGNSCSTFPTLSSSNSCFPSEAQYKGPKAISLSEEIIGLVLNKTRIFNYKELVKASDSFTNNIIACGFGTTYYKGVLEDGTMAAMNILLDRGTTKEFINDINALVNADHKNLVKLLGICAEGDYYTAILVFEYLKNGDLYETLFKKQPRVILSWPMRHRICIGVAEGLCYLHDHADIVHKSIKLSNILLDDDFVPKISGFGFHPTDLDYDDLSGPLKYTGDMAPEYFHTGCLTKEQDVYAFGMVILQIFSERPNFVSRIVEMAWELHKKGKLMELVDTTSLDVEKVIYNSLKIGLLCTQLNPALRPSISTVLEMLRNAL